MINNIGFKIIAGKINKIPEFYTIFDRKMPDYIIRQRYRGQAEAKCLRPRPRPRPKRGHFGLEDLTSLRVTVAHDCLKDPHVVSFYRLCSYTYLHCEA